MKTLTRAEKAALVQATAVRVLATAIEQRAVVDREATLDIFGHALQPREILWLVEAMPDAELRRIAHYLPGGEDMELVGALIGRTVRVLLVGREQPGLVGEVAQVLGRRVAARARALASAGAA